MLYFLAGYLGTVAFVCGYYYYNKKPEPVPIPDLMDLDPQETIYSPPPSPIVFKPPALKKRAFTYRRVNQNTPPRGRYQYSASRKNT